MNKARLSIWSGVLAVAVLTLACVAPAEARPPVSVHVGVGVGYPGPMRAWHGGYWHRGWYGPRFGWWGGVGPIWYNYPAAGYPYAYPYAYPYVPPVVVQTAPAKPGPAPAQYWYYCAASRAYYPYVSECPGGWRPVPANPTPPPSAGSRPGA